MKLPVVISSKCPYLSDETWTEMVVARLATTGDWQGPHNPFVRAEAVLAEDLALLFTQPPAERDPQTYVDRDYGTPPEPLTNQEAQTIRTLAEDGLTDDAISEIIGVAASTVRGVITGVYLPCAGGILNNPRPMGLRIPSWATTLNHMTAAVLVEAMNWLPPDLFELLCEQNGYRADRAFASIAMLENRNDEEDRYIYRSFLRGTLRTTAPGGFEANRPSRGRGRLRRV